MIHDTFRFGVCGEIGMVDIYTGTAEEWEASPLSVDESYSVIEFDDDTVRACKLTLPGSALVSSKATHDWLGEMMSCPRVTDCPRREIIRSRKPRKTKPVKK